MKICQLEKKITEELCQAGIEANEAASMARILLAYKLSIGLSQLPLHRDDELDDAAIAEMCIRDRGIPSRLAGLQKLSHHSLRGHKHNRINHIHIYPLFFLLL